MILFMSGPLDNLTAMNVNGTIQSISLKLSPPIVRLIIHAIKSLSLAPVSAVTWQVT